MPKDEKEKSYELGHVVPEADREIKGTLPIELAKQLSIHGIVKENQRQLERDIYRSLPLHLIDQYEEMDE